MRAVHLKNKLDELRKLNGLTQEEFAKELRVSRQTISAIENGKYNPSLDLAFEIALYFNMTIEEVFTYEKEENHAKK
ncbi:putative transcriptional regulator [Peptostreptococcaceae bacterium pGA-8]|nr:putative transcriptional regulator [Peptostreptococcaceae bacterium pGA-8]